MNIFSILQIIFIIGWSISFPLYLTHKKNGNQNTSKKWYDISWICVIGMDLMLIINAFI